MNIAGAAIFLGMIGALGVAVWGLFARRRSAFVGLTALAVALLAALGAWYAWAETVDHRVRGVGRGECGIGDASDEIGG